MAWKDLPVTGDPYRNVDESELDQISSMVQDGYVDEFGYTQKRPGLASYIDLGTSASVDGLFWWDAMKVVIVVSGGRVWKITDPSGTKTELTGATLTAGNRVTFAINGSTLTMANGGRMVTTDLTTLTTLADADAPTTVTHVAFLDGYTLANETGSQRFWWSDNNLPLSWNASAQSQANGSPDNLKALHVGWREILLAGHDSVESWYDDGVSPFTRLQGGHVQWGVGAIYSIQQVGANWTWLDQKRRFVRLDNRTPTVISTPYNKQIQAFSTIEDAVSDVMEINGLPIYVINFPGARRTLAYHYEKQTWMDWGSWNTSTASYDHYRGNCYCFARPWNLHLVGDVSNGQVYTASRSVYTDNGNPIRTIRRTGFVSHGLMQHKFSRELRIRMKRGAGNSSVTDPQLMVRWRNDGGAWSNEHWLSMGQVGQHEYVARIFRTGKYRVRQWEFCHSDNSDFVLIGAQENVEPATR